MNEIPSIKENLNVHKLLKRIYFFPIDLGKEDDEQQIFDTINSLGVRLTTAELLKNHLFDYSDEVLFKDTWFKVFEEKSEDKEFWDTIVGSRDKHSNLDSFLYAYMNIVNNNDIRYKTLFMSYKDYLVKHPNKKEFINDLIEYAKLYKKYINPNIQHEILKETSNSINRLNIVFFGLDTTTLLPYCLYVLKNVNSEEERNKIFGYLETYIIRRMICHEWTKNYNKKFKTFITQGIQTLQDLKNNILAGKDSDDRLPTDEYLKANMIQNHTNTQAKGILYLLETGLRMEKDNTQIKPMDAYDLEHIMPKDWKEHWGLTLGDSNPEDLIEARNTHVNRYLGNKTLLSQGLNKSIKNKSYQEKLTGGKKDENLGYKEFARDLKTFDFSKYQEWTEQTIEDRQNVLYKAFLKVWPYL